MVTSTLASHDDSDTAPTGNARILVPKVIIDRQTELLNMYIPSCYF